MNKETQAGKEKWGRRFKLGGIVAGILGLIAESSGLVLAAGGLIVGGIVFESKGKGKILKN